MHNDMSFHIWLGWNLAGFFLSKYTLIDSVWLFWSDVRLSKWQARCYFMHVVSAHSAFTKLPASNSVSSSWSIVLSYLILHQIYQSKIPRGHCYRRNVKKLQLHTTSVMCCRTCDACIMDTNCGFCYIKSDTELAVNGSCLAAQHNKQGDVIFNESAYGRCQQSTLHDPLHWAYSFCPTKFAWMATFGLVLYLVFFAPGRSTLSYHCVGFSVDVWTFLMVLLYYLFCFWGAWMLLVRSGTEWPFMCWCAVKKLLTHSLLVRWQWQPLASENVCAVTVLTIWESSDPDTQKY